VNENEATAPTTAAANKVTSSSEWKRSCSGHYCDSK